MSNPVVQSPSNWNPYFAFRYPRFFAPSLTIHHPETLPSPQEPQQSVAPRRAQHANHRVTAIAVRPANVDHVDFVLFVLVVHYLDLRGVEIRVQTPRHAELGVPNNAVESREIVCV